MSEELDNELLWVAVHEEVVSTTLTREEIIEIRQYIDKLETENMDLSNRIKTANTFIDQSIMYIVKPADYNKVEMLQDILNNTNYARKEGGASEDIRRKDNSED